MSLIFIFFFILNILFIIYIKKLSSIINLYDIPDNERKVHVGNIPILGGIIFCINLFFLGLLYTSNHYFNLGISIFSLINNYISFFFVFFCIFFVGLYDDKFHIKPYKKLILIFLLLFMAILVDQELEINIIRLSFFENPIQLGFFSSFFTALCFLLFLNAYNMFDGFNLQSISFLFFLLSMLLIFEQNYSFYFILFIVTLTIGYLNYKSLIFLGDSGTLSISYLIGYLFIKNYNNYNIENADIIFLLFMIPGIDMLRLFIFRIINKRSPFSADRNHLHHLLLDNFDYKLSIGIIILIAIMPFVLFLITNNELLAIIISTILYLVICANLEKHKNIHIK
jgi:UDP-GlcNAc:undecaprenyl-phosphate GlcNAc-1-phosphate transferase